MKTANTMDGVDRRPDAATCEALAALLVEFVWLIDHGRAGEVPALFTPQACLSSQGVRSVGRPALQARFEARAARNDIASRHVLSNLRLVQCSPDRISGWLLMTVYKTSPQEGPAPSAVVAEVEDVYLRCADGRWLIDERRVTTVFPGAQA